MKALFVAAVFAVVCSLSAQADIPDQNPPPGQWVLAASIIFGLIAAVTSSKQQPSTTLRTDPIKGRRHAR